jgi:hypothetical protein
MKTPSPLPWYADPRDSSHFLGDVLEVQGSSHEEERGEGFP